ncbi:MAG: hypothetical protein IKJ04_01425, partial [Clostridia bacterium]|nr:hypothetical protein [Clostridia bacterium]
MKFYRFIALLVCVLMIFPSCSGDVIDPIVTDPGIEYPTEEKTEAPTHISLAGYKVVRSDKASKEIVSAAVDMRKTLDEMSGDITIGDDWVKSGTEIPETALEILVGKTNRPESAEASRDLLADDFAVKYFPESGRIVLVGGSDEATLKAVRYFLE